MGNLDTLTFRLFARPSFIEGMGRILDMGNSLNTYNRDDAPEMADKRSLESDWRMVGRDIKGALETHDKISEK